jgi:hypothetical protein
VPSPPVRLREARPRQPHAVPAGAPVAGTLASCPIALADALEAPAAEAYPGGKTRPTSIAGVLLG